MMIQKQNSDDTRELAESSSSGCRFCNAPLRRTFIDLGVTPLCQTHISADRLDLMEPFYPLHARVCENCLLVQLDQFATPAEIFEEYAYFSSYSASWLRHAQNYCDKVAKRFGLDGSSFVVEIASNDGYLLQNFVAAGIPALGIEPAANVAEAAREKGVETLVKFFGEATAKEVRRSHSAADLIVGNNVLAHVPALNDFVGGIKILLADAGVVTMEFPHLMRLMEQAQFDTIYHEHFSYFSFLTVERIFRAHSLAIFDVEQLSTHGGSLRIYCQHEAGPHKVTAAVRELVLEEKTAGLDRVDAYQGFPERVHAIKRDLLDFLIAARRQGKSVVGYGAPGKGNTLLNYCGIGTDFLDYTVDRNPYKQGKYTPGSRIPILAPEKIRDTKPDYILILPWNLRKEIVESHPFVADWGGRFVVPIPTLEVIDP